MWRRYCEAIGLTMGEGIAGLIDHELGALVSEDEHQEAVFAPEMSSGWLPGPRLSTSGNGVWTNESSR
jgi:hypothetical protein